MTDEQCESCHLDKPNTIAAVVSGVYYRHVCQKCLGGVDISSNAASFERRRQYEDYAADTIQPYSASGPNVEFYRLYKTTAEKIFSKEEIEQVRKKI